jgi:general secretion pathway protein C
MLLRKVLSFAVPASIALAAFLHAHAIGSLIDATTVSAPLGAPAASIAPFAEARAAETAGGKAKSADPILDRNPFDHVTGPLRHLDGQIVADAEIQEVNPFAAPPCDGVRAVAAIRATDAEASFAALDLGGGKHVLRKRGGELGAETSPTKMRVVYVGEDRVWLSRDGALCQAKVFGAPPVVVPASVKESNGSAPAAPQSKLESDVTKKIQKTGPTSYEIDRGAVSQILEAQTELMKVPLVPEKENGNVVGFKMVKIKEGSVLSALGLMSGDRLVSINGIEVTSTERMVEAYARLRSGTLTNFTINVVRNGKPTNLDYQIK